MSGVPLLIIGARIRLYRHLPLLSARHPASPAGGAGGPCPWRPAVSKHRRSAAIFPSCAEETSLSGAPVIALSIHPPSSLQSSCRRSSCGRRHRSSHHLALIGVDAWSAASLRVFAAAEVGAATRAHRHRTHHLLPRAAPAAPPRPRGVSRGGRSAAGAGGMAQRSRARRGRRRGDRVMGTGHGASCRRLDCAAV